MRRATAMIGGAQAGAQAGGDGGLTPECVERDIFAAQLLSLARNAAFASLTSPVNSVLVAAFLWTSMPRAQLMAWVGAMMAVTLARLLLFHRYRLLEDHVAAAPLWGRIFAAGYLVTGVLWGVVGLWIYQLDNPLTQAILTVVVAGMTAGGAVTMACHMPSMAAFVYPAGLSAAAAYLAKGDGQELLALMMVVFLAAMTALARNNNRSFVEARRLELENRALSGDLQAARDQLLHAISASPDGFALYDADDLLVLANAQLGELGDDPNSPLAPGTPIREMFDYTAAKGVVADAVGREREWVAEMMALHRRADPAQPYELHQRNGRWIRVTKRRTKDGGTVAVYSDVTELKDREEKLRQSESRFRDFAEAASDWIWETDAQHRFTLISGRFTELTGLDVSSYIGKRRQDIPVVDPESPAWREHLRDLEARRPFRDIEMGRHDPDGKIRHYVISGKPVYDDDGEFLGYRGTGSDITHRVQVEALVKQAQARLVDAIESVPAAFMLFDADDRLILWNNKTREFMPEATKLLAHGTGYEELLRAAAESGEVVAAVGREDAWVAEQLAWHRQPDSPMELAYTDGRSVQLREVATQDGGTVAVRTDVTDIRRGQQELAASTRLLKGTLEAMDQGLVVVDRDETIQLTNPQVAGMLSLPREAVGPGMRLDDLKRHLVDRGELSDDHFNAQTELLRRITTAGETHELERVRADGTVLSVRSNPMPDGGWVTTYTDVTRIKEAERALRDSEQRYRRLVELSPDIIAIHSGGRIVFINSAGARCFGATTPEVLFNRPALDLVHADSRDTANAFTVTPDPADHQGEITFHELRLLRLDGTAFEAEAAGIRFMYQGAPAVQVIARDITMRKLAQSELVQTSKLATLGEMAAGLAHELNQPLNIIRMAADACLILMEDAALQGDEDAADPEYHRKQFELIGQQTQRMAQIIDHMRIFNRRDSALSEPFDPADCVERSIALIDDQFRLDDIAIAADVARPVPRVMGHPIRMEQVLLNLLTNARDAIMQRRHSDAAAPAGCVTISVAPSAAGDAVHVSVADTGGGIPDDLRDRVFDPFFTTKEVGSGTGLGLSIGYGIVAAMGGKIETRNEGDGAVFDIVLPTAAEAADAAVAQAGQDD